MMALSRILAASLVVTLLVLHFTEAHQITITAIDAPPALAPAPSPFVPHPIDCGAACEGRCKLSSRPKLCKRACGGCCAKCRCVSPGTLGNHNSCPCYASLTTGPNHVRRCP